MDDDQAALWVLERDLWLGGSDVYGRHVDDEALMLFPGMVLTKPQAVEAVAGSRWTTVTFDDRRVIQVAPEVAALTYRASGIRQQDSPPYRALVSSVYARRHGGWRLVLHQQSPADRPA